MHWCKTKSRNRRPARRLCWCPIRLEDTVRTSTEPQRPTLPEEFGWKGLCRGTTNFSLGKLSNQAPGRILISSAPTKSAAVLSGLRKVDARAPKSACSRKFGDSIRVTYFGDWALNSDNLLRFEPFL